MADFPTVDVPLSESLPSVDLLLDPEVPPGAAHQEAEVSSPTVRPDIYFSNSHSGSGVQMISHSVFERRQRPLLSNSNAPLLSRAGFIRQNYSPVTGASPSGVCRSWCSDYDFCYRRMWCPRKWTRPSNGHCCVLCDGKSDFSRQVFSPLSVRSFLPFDPCGIVHNFVHEQPV